MSCESATLGVSPLKEQHPIVAASTIDDQGRTCRKLTQNELGRYANTFVAEVGLNKALDARRQQMKNKSAVDTRAAPKAPAAVVTIHNVECNADMLEYESSDGFGNVKEEWRQVRALKDEPFVGVSTRNFEGIATMMSKREEKHNGALADLRADMKVIEDEVWEAIRGESRVLAQKLTENDLLIEELGAKIASDDTIKTLTLEELGAIKKTADAQVPLRKQWIEEFCLRCLRVEEEKSRRIESVLHPLGTTISTIAYVTTSAVEAITNDLCTEINVKMVRDYRCHLETAAGLLHNNTRHGKAFAEMYDKRVLEWRTLRHSHCLHRLREFMGSPCVRDPPERKEILSDLKEKQKLLYAKLRNHLLNTKNHFGRMSKGSFRKWNDHCFALYDDISTLLDLYDKKLKLYDEGLHEKCLSFMNEDTLGELLSCGVFPESELKGVINTEFMPMLTKRQEKAAVEQESMMQSLSEHLRTTKQFVQNFTDTVNEILKFWTKHEKDSWSLPEKMRKAVSEIRARSHKVKQECEGVMDSLVAQLRHAGNMKDLDVCCKEAVDYLETLGSGFQEFSDEVNTVVEGCAAKTDSCLVQYHTKLLSFFRVSISAPESDPLSSGASTTTPMGQDVSNGNGNKEECIITVGDVKYYSDPSLPATRYGRVLQASENIDVFVSESVRNNVVADPTLTARVVNWEENLPKIVKVFRKTYFTHFYAWKKQLKDHVTAEVETFKIELKEEMKLNQHFHSPRAERVRSEIYTLRFTELQAHERRVEEHLLGVTQRLDKQQPQMDPFISRVGELHLKLCNVVVQAVKELGMASNVEHAEQIQCRAEDQMCTFRREHTSVIDKHMAGLQKDVEEMMEANALLKASFTPFDVGGNFAPEEITRFSARLEAVDKKIRQDTQVLVTECRELQERLDGKYTDILETLQEEAEVHIEDLVQLGKIKRCLGGMKMKILSVHEKSNIEADEVTQCINRLEELCDLSANQIDSSRGNLYTSDDPGTKKGSREATNTLQLLELVHTLCTMTRKRGQYLDCLNSHIPVFRLDTWMNDLQDLLEHPESEIEGKQWKNYRMSTIDNLTKTRVSNVVSPTPLETDAPRPCSSNSTPLTVMETVSGMIATAREQLIQEGGEFFAAKGDRNVVFVETLCSTFEKYQISITERTENIAAWAQDVLYDAVKKFRAQVKRLAKVALRIPEIVLQYIVTFWIDASSRTRLNHERQCKLKVKKSLEAARKYHEETCRPSLGHPSQSHVLRAYCDQEAARSDQIIKDINAMAVGSCTEIEKNGYRFLERVTLVTRIFITLFDTCVYPPDISDEAMGSVEPKPKSFRNLLEQQKVKMARKKRNTTASGRKLNKRIWKGLPRNELLFSFWQTHKMNPMARPEEGPSFGSFSTLLHKTVVEARDKAYKKYIHYTFDAFYNIESTREQLKQDESEWEMYCSNSVKTLSDFFQRLPPQKQID